MTCLTLRWIKSIGGIDGVAKRRDEKAAMLYGAIENSNGYYMNPVDRASRSPMNVVWRLLNENLEKKFIEEAGKAGLSGLKGHRSVGGCRASIYNAMPVEGVKTLTGFMKTFRENNE
jgi:phosphoserine aminotransferase